MSTRSNRAFTLVEMLVVIGIIAILAVLLIPAINMAIRAARNAAIGVEVNQLATAIESYKQDKGDYPPNFRNQDVVLRHIRKCYPKADPTYIAAFVTRACTMPPTPQTATPTGLYFIDEGEALVFWLSMTDNDPRFPFLSYFNPGTTPLTPAPKRYYDFDETRLAPVNSNEVDQTAATRTADVRSHIAKFCQDSYYIYVDSRSYAALTASATLPAGFAYAENNAVGVWPYWSTATAAMNATTFQILCTGQDGEFGALTAAKRFPSGLNYEREDNDNIANFSAGRTLGDSIP